MELQPATSLLANRLAFESRDVDEVRHQVGRYFKPHTIRFLDERKRNLNASLYRSSIGTIAVNLLEYGANVMIDPGALKEFYLLHINIDGACEVTYQDGHLTTDKSVGAVCSPHRPYRFWWQPGSRVLAIQIPRAKLHAHMRDVTGFVPRQDIDFDTILDLGRASSTALVNLAQYLVTDACNEEGLASDPLTAKPLEKALMTALLRCQPGSHQNTLEAAGNCAAPSYVKRAEAHMRANLNRTLRLNELASVGQTSERSLTEGFRRFRGETPARYFLALRLAQARRDLQAADPEATVADIAFNLGFQHLSSFASAYREHYDELPSQTLRQASGPTGT